MHRRGGLVWPPFIIATGEQLTDTINPGPDSHASSLRGRKGAITGRDANFPMVAKSVNLAQGKQRLPPIMQTQA